MKRIIASEFNECLALVQYLEMKGLRYCHIHQEMYTTSWSQKNKAKALGVKSGVPDYMVLLPTGILFIEMKREKGGVLSPAQQDWQAALNATPNVQAVTCYGAQQAVDLVEELL